MFINHMTDPSTATTRPRMCDRALLPIGGTALAHPRQEFVRTGRFGIRTTGKAVLMGRRAWGPPI
ncbi:MAG: hypothetical protein M3419_03840 [Actinomycetota bacterium]|nr:hypothetical protein [Actinomycetota bacterium]